MRQLSKKSFFGAAIGTMVEYYDSVLFAIFLPIIAPLFFPAASAYHALMKAYYILLIPMLARPLGGLLFGHIGDVLGRRKALLGSMYGIAVSTFMIGLIPSYQAIGVWAIVMIVFFKSIQVFCFGGEYSGAGIYVVEHANNKNEALMGGLLTAMTLLGSLMASFIGIIVTLHFMPAWSWRLVFILGGAIGVFGILYRKNLLESPEFKKTTYQHHRVRNLIKNYPRELLAGIFIGGFATVPFMTVLAFVNPVLMTKGYFSAHHFMILQTILIAIAIVTLIVAGHSADKKSPATVMQLGAVLLVLFSYPLSCLFDRGLMAEILIAQVIFVVINEVLLGPSNAYLKSLFPMQYRYRGSSLSFCIGMSVFGGLTPVVENFLYQWTGHFSAISIWLVFIGLGTLLSIRFAETSRARAALADYHA